MYNDWLNVVLLSSNTNVCVITDEIATWYTRCIMENSREK